MCKPHPTSSEEYIGPSDFLLSILSLPIESTLCTSLQVLKVLNCWGIHLCLYVLRPIYSPGQLLRCLYKQTASQETLENTQRRRPPSNTELTLQQSVLILGFVRAWASTFVEPRRRCHHLEGTEHCSTVENYFESAGCIERPVHLSAARKAMAHMLGGLGGSSQPPAALAPSPEEVPDIVDTSSFNAGTIAVQSKVRHPLFKVALP